MLNRSIKSGMGGVDGLAAHGVPKLRIHFESFSPGGGSFGEAPAADLAEDDTPPVLDAEGQPIVVTFSRSGKSVPWRAGSRNLLLLAEQAGLRPHKGCRSGLCGACNCRIEHGRIHYTTEPVEPPEEGTLLLCCAQPATSVTLDL